MRIRLVLRLGVAGLALSIVAACGRSTPAPAGDPAAAPASGTAAQATPTAPPSAAPTAAQAGQRSTATAVEFERLVELLPEVDGWRRSTPRGEQVVVGTLVSRAEASYEQDSRRVDLDITDSAFESLVLSPLTMFLGPSYSERSNGSYRRSAPIGGQPGFESWNDDTRRAEVTVVVAGRFVIHAEGLNVGNPDPVRAIVRAIDVSRLASLK